MKLKIALQENRSTQGRNIYHNRVNAEDYKVVALVLQDLEALGVPIEKAIKEFHLNKRSVWDMAIGA